MDKMPDVIYIGYQKSGSALLRSYFSFHPEITWSRTANIFQRYDYEKLKATYLDNFPESEANCLIDMFEGLATGFIFTEQGDFGEVGFTPGISYENGIMQPNVKVIAQRIKSLVPNAKILISIRNQVDWLRSNYLHFLHLLPKDRSRFVDFLNTPEGKQLLWVGNFDQTISAYQNVFGKANVKVILLENLRDEMDLALKELCAFLEVNHVGFPEYAWDKNTGKSPVQGQILRTFSRFGIRKNRVINTLGTSLLPLITILWPASNRDVVSQDAKELINALYSASNHITSGLIDLNLSEHGYPL